MPQASGLQFTVTIGGFPSDHFALVGFALTERLSELFHGRIELASSDPSVLAAAVLEQPADLVIWRDGAAVRRFTGVVSEFVRRDSGHRRTRYELVIQPPVWRLGLMHNSRIFQGQTTGDIIRALLEERGVVDTEFELKDTPVEREYCVQHRESDLAFVERLAAEEGWFYRYRHGSVDGQESPALILADHHGSAPTLEAAEYNSRAGGAEQGPCVYRFEHRERIRAASVAMKDYTFRNPAYGLLQEQGAASPSHRADYQHYEYPGRFKQDQAGERFTAARLDALRNDANTGNGESNRADFVAGARVALTHHDNEALNRDWLLVAVTHTGRQPQALEEEGGSGATTYQNYFSTIPADRTWRPLCEHKPLMDGPQMAVVTGPEGEEIHCDRYGRVKVRFPWDRYSANDEHSSAWLRVSQDWAGGQYGFMALPRIGHEVIVSFLDGDPDQPIVTGRTHHATNTPPYALPEHKTRTTLKTRTHKGEGSNELRFEDEADQEQIYVHAQKDLALLTEHNRTEVIRNDSHLTVENNRFSHTRGNSHRTVDGEKREQTGKDHSFDVTGTLHLKAGTAWLSESGTELHIKAGQKAVIEAGAEITLKAGGSFVKIDPSGVAMGGASIKMNAGGAPGKGSGQRVQVPEMPGLVTTAGGFVAPVALAEVDQRMHAQPKAVVAHRLRQARMQGTAIVEQCQQQPDGSCPLGNCPCGKNQSA
ncbi:type VI secretion system Vgr family protein [Marinobacter sp.]|uniref:type VI secretion system Vgr family protein n=1 Tax=Marinobacter sp. TaxID=50741 RepID=UPI0035C66AA8